MTPQDEGRLLLTVEYLVEEMKTVSIKLEKIEARLSYGKGALATLLVIASTIGGLFASYMWGD